MDEKIQNVEAMNLERLKTMGEKFKAELEKGDQGRYPELAEAVRDLKRLRNELRTR